MHEATETEQLFQENQGLQTNQENSPIISSEGSSGLNPKNILGQFFKKAFGTIDNNRKQRANNNLTIGNTHQN